MSRVVTLTLNVQLIVVMDEGIELQEVVNELDFTFIDGTGSAEILDAVIIDYDIIDSK